MVYCTTVDDGLSAFRAASGTKVWSNPSVRGTVVAMRSNQLLVWDGEQASTVDPASGDLIEQITLPYARWLRADSFVDGNLYVVSKGGAVAKFTPRR